MFWIIVIAVFLVFSTGLVLLVRSRGGGGDDSGTAGQGGAMRDAEMHSNQRRVQSSGFGGGYDGGV